MLNFLFAFFLKISETLEAHISGTETYQQTVKSFLFRFQRSFIFANKKLSKISMHSHFKVHIRNHSACFTFLYRVSQKRYR